MITNHHDLENDRQADERDRESLELENAQVQLEGDLFDAYMTNNGYVVDWVDDQIQDNPSQLLKLLRDNFTVDGLAMRTRYMNYVGKLCKKLAESIQSAEEIDRLYKDADLYLPEVTGKPDNGGNNVSE